MADTSSGSDQLPSVSFAHTDISAIPTEADLINTSGWYETETLEQVEISSEAGKARIATLQLDGWAQYGNQSTTGGKTYIAMKRRRFSPEKALKAITKAFTNAYNQANSENISRYNRILQLYSGMLTSTNTYFNTLEGRDDAFNDAAIQLIEQAQSELAAFIAEVDTIFDDYGDAQRARINQQFDNLLSEQQANLTARGLANTSIMGGITATIEEKRAIALNDLEDKITDRELTHKGDLYKIRTALNNAIRDEYSRMRQIWTNFRKGLIDDRNGIVKTIGQFIEARNDNAPTLESVANAAAQLGMVDTANQPTE